MPGPASPSRDSIKSHIDAKSVDDNSASNAEERTWQGDTTQAPAKSDMSERSSSAADFNPTNADMYMRLGQMMELLGEVHRVITIHHLENGAVSGAWIEGKE